VLADDGELLIASDRLMSGYFELPIETDEAIRDGWYTPAIWRADDEGYSHRGRKREVIRTGGETVHR